MNTINSQGVALADAAGKSYGRGGEFLAKPLNDEAARAVEVLERHGGERVRGAVARKMIERYQSLTTDDCVYGICDGGAFRLSGRNSCFFSLMYCVRCGMTNIYVWETAGHRRYAIVRNGGVV